MEEAGTIVEVEGLTKRFGGAHAIDGVTFSLKAGEFVSLLGPSGCGKTVLLRILCGLLGKSEGRVNFHFSRDEAINVSLAFQRSPLFPWMNVFDNIRICMNNRSLTRRGKDELALQLLERAGLARFRRRYPDELSAGMRQKVNVLRCFAGGGELVMMDEPFVSLDFIQRTELQKFTLRLWQEERKTLLFVTHNIHEALILSDRILVMSAPPGKIVADVPVPLPRPRHVTDVRKEPAYHATADAVNALLEAEVRAAEEKNVSWLAEGRR